MLWDTFFKWFMHLGAEYGVNPVIFGGIYVGGMPFLWLSLAWLVRNIRTKRPVVAPGITTGLLFSSSYLYVVIAGRHIPAWVYLLLAAMLVAGVYSTAVGIRRKVAAKSK